MLVGNEEGGNKNMEATTLPRTTQGLLSPTLHSLLTTSKLTGVDTTKQLELADLRDGQSRFSIYVLSGLGLGALGP